MTMKKVLGCIRKADQEFDMIQDNDKICVLSQSLFDIVD